MPINNSTEKTRNAPAEKASTYDEGYTMDGSDGIAYVVKTYTNGVKRWIKKPSEEEKPSEDEEEKPSEYDKDEEEKPSEYEKDEKKPSEKKK